MIPTIRIGPLEISWFGLITAGGWLISLGLAALIAHRQGLETKHLLRTYFWGMVGAYIVGRLIYILNPPAAVAVYTDRTYYLTHILDLQAGPLTVWHGGLSRAGVILGAAAGSLNTLRRQKALTREMIGALAVPALALFVLLPWGNIVNQQMLGPETRLIWGIATEMGKVHPTPAYLSAGALAILIALVVAERRDWAGSHTRRLLWAGLALAALALGLEFLRTDSEMIGGGVSEMMVLAAAGMIGAGRGLIRSKQTAI